MSMIKGEREREQVAFRQVIRDPYREFQQEEGIPAYRGFHIDDLGTLEVKPWARMGGLGAYINLLGEEFSGDNYVCEIPRGQSLNPQRHLFEELVYVVSGRGATTFWTRQGEPKWTFEWGEHSLFALPANIGYQHFNGDATRPARLFAKTTLPALFQYFRDKRFIFENDSVFEEAERESYLAEPKVYTSAEPENPITWAANFVPDARAFDKMPFLESRGAGGKSIFFHQPALIRLHAHQSDFPVATYKKAHAHPPGRSIILVAGKGYSLVWQPGHEKEKTKVDWHADSLFGVALSDLQGEIWWHQHFNTGDKPARYLVLHVNPQLADDKHVQLEYVNEDPATRKLFGDELAKSRLENKMPPECYTDPNYRWKAPV